MHVYPIYLSVIDRKLEIDSKKGLLDYIINFGIHIFYSNCVEYCQQIVSHTQNIDIIIIDNKKYLKIISVT